MKIGIVTVIGLVASAVLAVAVEPVEAQITESPVLHKRYRDKIINKDWQKLQDDKAKLLKGESIESSSEAPRPWHRTIYGSKVEIVRPTVIAGVTFSAKPPATTNGLEPWISLDKHGAPKTIKPEYKNGHIKKSSPDYSTWFATATTVVYNKEELKAHNMGEDDVHEDVQYIPEDLTYQSLNPIIRCTPDYYAKKGLAKDVLSEPFCFPRDNAIWKMDKTYFVTWYSKFFGEDVEKVKVHLSYIKEKAKHKGMKRDYEEKDFVKRSSVMEKGASISQKSFFSSDWIPNSQGFFPVTIDPEWIGGSQVYNTKALISIQPDNVSDEDFNFMSKFVVVELTKGSKVNKEHLVDVKKMEEKWRAKELNGELEIEEGIDYEKYITILSLPTFVAFAALGMYFFVFLNRKNVDLSHLKRRKFAGKNTTHRKIPFKKRKNEYSELPQFSNVEMTKHD